jgi:hypothetical protein
MAIPFAALAGAAERACEEMFGKMESKDGSFAGCKNVCNAL